MPRIDIVKRIIKDSRKSLIIMTIISIVMGGLFVLVYPSIKENELQYQQLLETLPKEFMGAFGIENLDFGNFGNYISSRYLSLFWAIVYLPFTFSWALRLAAEAQSGKLAFLLSYPLKRSVVYSSYLLALVVKASFASLMLISGILLPAIAINVELNLGNWAIYTLFMTAVINAFAIITFTLGAIFMQRSLANGLSLLIFGGGYFVNVISKLVEQAENTKYFSIFYYYGSPDKILRGEPIPAISILFFILIILVLPMIGVIVFNRKDLPR